MAEDQQSTSYKAATDEERKPISKNDSAKLTALLKTSALAEEDKKWWLERVEGLNRRQAKQLWKLLHANSGEDLDKIIEEEGEYQVKLKKELDHVVKEGTAKIYHEAEEKETEIEEKELEQLVKDEGLDGETPAKEAPPPETPKA